MMSVTRLAVEDLRGLPLRGPEDMFTALAELDPEGWEGAVERDPSGWKLRLSLSGKQTVNATVGQWLVFDPELRVISAEQFTSAYSSDEVAFPPPPPAPEPAAAEPEEVEIQVSEDTAVPMALAIR